MLELLINTIIEGEKELIDTIRQGEALPPLNLRRSARLPVVAAVQSVLQCPVILLTDRSDRAMLLADELSIWAPESLRLSFPEPTPLFYENAPWGVTTRRDRMAALTMLSAYHLPAAQIPEQAPIIIAPARAVMTRTLPRRDFLKALRTIKPGTIVQPEELLRAWLAMGFEQANTVITPGQFARRGGILDIWPPAEPQPGRIELFGDEIDTLRSFEPSTQRTVHPLESLRITPAREFISPPVEGASANPPAPPSEFLIPLLHPTPASLLDYLPRSAVIMIDDAEAVRETVTEVEEQALGLRQDYIEDGELQADFPIPYLSWQEIEDSLTGKQVIDLGRAGTEEDDLPITWPKLTRHFSAVPRFGGRLKPVIEHLAQNHANQETTIIVSRQSARLKELWCEQNPTSDLSQLDITFLDGSLSEGFTYSPENALRMHLLTDGEIFGWRRPELRQRPRPVAEDPESAYADLQVDDWIVHVDHGIGRFTGLVNRTVDGVERDYLCVEYAEGDQLYVPVYQADRLTRYIGPEGRAPSISRLGSIEWKNSKSRVSEAVIEVAEDLLELYARRNIVVGHSFSKDSPWQQELETSFPYIETGDQLRVIGEVKDDMERTRPMDRLICGDVGYGKTEVALRAAFKAVMDGKQVAILVPTTVLAQQHYHTFCERLAAFPVAVEMLSRFRTPQQQREILYKLAQGSIDIIIGTHRLIQGDVNFKDLGLLVIDEEQRFGVGHKETLKKMRTEVDVLTLTATPIPRTLYMALTGARDISTINTPPEERLPIITHVGPYSPRLARQAILRELERGGQVFFVHNRVQTIDAMRSHLTKLVPEARLTIAHGQMPEQELSQRMDQFTLGEVDILLCTSIIESGLDIPNANTLIVDRADTFGLAQLYQLRGRVGRGAQRAYAYFFRHSRHLPTLEGRQRLETLAENTQLGAGFSIAMRDLEIRGAGDILGMRQHGHIAAVGFHLYTRLLADAVRRMRSSPEAASRPGDSTSQPSQQPSSPLQLYNGPLALPVNVDLPIPVSIPVDYVTERETRVRLYRRIADMRSQQELDTLAEEFLDRFGPLPAPVANLLVQMRIKLMAEKAGMASVSSENGQIVLRYPPLPEGATSRDLSALSHLVSLGVRLGKNALWMPFQEQENWLSRLLNVLEAMN
ncbi:MAG: transcription-repair coupling factor [Anaerolineales bacterium]|nr:transcription-repair coupling factor [Anaerolineales bacterium]